MTVDESAYDPATEQTGGTAPRDTETLDSFVGLQAILAAMRRRRRVWLATAAVGLLCGIAYTFAVPTKYTATSTLILVHSPGDSASLDMANDVALVDTSAVARRVVSALKLSTPASSLTSEYSAVAVSTSVMQITDEASSAASALRLMRAIVPAFLSVRTEVYTSQTASTVRALNAEATTLNAKVRALNQEIVYNERAGASVTALQQEQSELVSQLAQLQQAISSDQADLSLVANGTRVLVPAELAPHSRYKRRLVDWGVGLGGGLAVGLAYVGLGTVLSDRIRRRDQLARAVGATTVLTTPGFHSRQLFGLSALRRRFRNPRASERQLAGFLASYVDDAPDRRLVIVSIASRKAVGLAVSIAARTLALQGRTVSIVDASPDRSVARLLRVRATPRSIATAGGAERVEAAVVTRGSDDGSGVHIEVKAPGVSSVVARGATLLVTEQASEYDAAQLSRAAKHAVVVVTAGQVNAATVQLSADLLQRAGISIVGTILVGPDSDADSVSGSPHLPVSASS